MIGRRLLAIALLGLAGCRLPTSSIAPASGGAPAVRFTDVTAAAGIRFRHVTGAFGRKWMPETMGSGCAFLDYDGDGWLDLFLVNGAYWPGRRGAFPTYPALYRNRGDGRFDDVTRAAGLAHEFYGMGVAVGDYDGDDDDDLFLTGVGGVRLYRNDSGRFREVSRQAGVAHGGWSTSAAWLDYDRDGRLDLFVAHYVKWTPATDLFVTLDGVNKTYATPRDYPGEPCRLYRNLGPDATGIWRFADVSLSSGIGRKAGKSLGVAVCDYDRDGWPDLVVANDTVANFLFHNQGRTAGRGEVTFREVGTELGVALPEAGRAKAGMGVDTADFLEDGREAILITNFSGEQATLYHQDGTGGFRDIAARSGVGLASQQYLGFGAFFFDYDLDGWQDLFLANGHIQDDIAVRNTGVTYAEPALLLRNLGNGRVLDVTGEVGGALVTPVVARGAAYGDYDNDGDLDLLITTSGGPARLLRDDNRTGNGWLRLVLVGAPPNRNAFGATVHVQVGPRRLTRYVRSGSSYLSQSDRRLLIGLGRARRADAIEIEWPDGRVQSLGPQSAGTSLVVRQSP